ncbi:MAG: molybdopterin-synthase adenylyltransferase MoeB [Lachnospiraceae bacterium]|nr:molybdopterin-synthase adenylyltransferase MoeB [Lachnospiraceae bacterium]
MGRIFVSATLRSFFGRNASFETDHNTIKGMLDFLTDEYPDSRNILFAEDGKLRSFIRIYVDTEDRTDPAKWEETVLDSQEVLLLPAIAGGAPTKSIILEDRRKETLLSDKEVERYEKHLLLRQIGVKGQKRIKAARVVVVGAGALGSPVIQYLAAAGVGNIKVIDFDEVSINNLQNQVLHTSRDLDRPKVASARDKVRNINRDILFEDVNLKLEADNIADEIDGYDLVIDCSDNYKARYLVNDACVICDIPLVFGAIYQFEGQVSVFHYEDGPCYRCLFPSPPPAGLVPTCAEGGSISPLAGIIGSIQATEALKIIMGIGETLSGKLLTVDSLYLRSKIIDVTKNEKCPICGEHPSISVIQDFDYDDFCGLKAEGDEVEIEGVTPEELSERIERGDNILIIDVREPHERAILKFPNAVVIPIGQLARRMKELDPSQDTIFICKEGKRSVLAITTLREAGYKGPLYNLKGGMDAMRDIIFSNEGAWL